MNFEAAERLDLPTRTMTVSLYKESFNNFFQGHQLMYLMDVNGALFYGFDDLEEGGCYTARTNYEPW